MQEPEHCHATDGSVFVETPLWTQKACRRDITIKRIFIMLNAISQQFILIAVLSSATFENQELTKIKYVQAFKQEGRRLIAEWLRIIMRLLRKELPFQPLIPTNPANSPTMVGPLCLLHSSVSLHLCNISNKYYTPVVGLNTHS